jgi:hypothetical protein
MKAKAAKSAQSAQLPSATARYIAMLVGELEQLARSHGLDGLAYILDMARLEADQIAKGSEGSNGAADTNGRAA